MFTYVSFACTCYLLQIVTLGQSVMRQVRRFSNVEIPSRIGFVVELYLSFATPGIQSILGCNDETNRQSPDTQPA